MDCLEDEVKTIAQDDEIGAVVITGAGQENFSVGMNLKEIMTDLSDRGGSDGVLDQRLRVLTAIENMGKPWVATLYGYCLGGGFELPLACHFRLASETGAQIGPPEFDLGRFRLGVAARACRSDLDVRSRSIWCSEPKRFQGQTRVNLELRTRSGRSLN